MDDVVNVVVCPVLRFSQETPDKPAIITDSETVSYQKLHQMACRFKTDLPAGGSKPGLRIGFMFQNCPDYIARLTAAWRSGVVAVPLNNKIPGKALEPLMKELQLSGYYMFAPVFESGKEKNSDLTTPSLIPLANGATIIMTSGSTGKEKAVFLTYANHYYNALGSNQNIQVRPGDRWLLSLPLYHVGGLGIVFRALIAGAGIVIPAKDETVLESIQKHRVTHVSLVSTQLHRLLERLEPSAGGKLPWEISSLKAVLLGGGKFSKALISKALTLGLPVHTTYGMSEAASQVTTTPPGAPPEKLFTSGRVLKHREIKISPQGEIMVRGATLFYGYLEKEKLVQNFDKEGWFATGDVGEIDSEGYLHVKGRLDNMFISGGENIMPEEIENHLNQLPGVEQAIVIPVEDVIFGQRPVAFLKTRRPGLLAKDVVINYLQECLPRYKIPDVFYLWPQMEVNEPVEKSLKVKRPFLFELLENPKELTTLFCK